MCEVTRRSHKTCNARSLELRDAKEKCVNRVKGRGFVNGTIGGKEL